MKHSSITHFLTGNEFNQSAINHLLSLAIAMKKNPLLYSNALKNQTIALVFEKPSLRTRFSFTSAIHQLGAQAIESVSHTRKSEAPKDFIRVIQGYCSAMMIRTFDDHTLEIMKNYAKIPIINGLTDQYHPCQSLADLMTLKEKFKNLDNLKIAYIGDGNNILHSLILMTNKLNINLHYCCPKNHQPKQTVLDRIANKTIVKAFYDPKEAVKNCHAVYTDVWTSMGFQQRDESNFTAYQVNETLMSYAKDNAVFMHCMPMNRGKEVSVNLPDAPCSVIFTQSQNRMYVQKALLLMLLNKEAISTEWIN